MIRGGGGSRAVAPRSRIAPQLTQRRTAAPLTHKPLAHLAAHMAVTPQASHTDALHMPKPGAHPKGGASKRPVSRVSAMVRGNTPAYQAANAVANQPGDMGQGADIHPDPNASPLTVSPVTPTAGMPATGPGPLASAAPGDGGGGGAPSSDGGSAAPVYSDDGGGYDDGGDDGGDDSGGDDGGDDSGDDGGDDSGDDGGDDSGDDSGDDGSDVAGEAPPGVSCYVQDGRLICMAVVQTPYGPVPMSACVKLSQPAHNGPVQFAGEVVEPAKDRLFSQQATETIKQVAESLVIRSRQGDQVATDILAMTREAASDPENKRARMAQQAVLDYCRTHPVMGDAPSLIAGESNSSVYRTAVRLANGPPLTPDHLGHVASQFAGASKRHRHIMMHGTKVGMSQFGDDSQLMPARSQLSEGERVLLDLGHAMGLALAIQRLRRTGSIKEFSTSVAWELGAA